MTTDTHIDWTDAYERAWAAEVLGVPGLASREQTDALQRGDTTDTPDEPLIAFKPA